MHNYIMRNKSYLQHNYIDVNCIAVLSYASARRFIGCNQQPTAASTAVTCRATATPNPFIVPFMPRITIAVAHAHKAFAVNTYMHAYTYTRTYKIACQALCAKCRRSTLNARGNGER